VDIEPFYLGVLGSLVGAAVPAPVLLVQAELLGGCGLSCGGGSFSLHRYDFAGGPSSQRTGSWRPWVDETSGGRPHADEGPFCRGGGMRWPAPQLRAAPLPPAFDPSRAPQELAACVLVQRDGRVTAVRLVGAGSAEKAPMLLPAIRAGWRFAPSPGEPGWVRVRLSSQVTRRPPDVGSYPL
jgi:hypothetical protein